MFDWLKKQFKRDEKEGVQTMADLFSGDIKDVPSQLTPEPVKEYFAPVPGRLKPQKPGQNTVEYEDYDLMKDFRIRDFARELPGAVGDVAKEIAQGTARSFDWAGRKIAPYVLPGYKDMRKDGEWTNMEQFLFGDTGKKFSESKGEIRDIAEAEWGLNRDSMFAPLVGGITVGLDLLPGGKGVRSMFKAAIKETDPRIIKGWLKAARPEAPDDAIENLAKIVAESTDKKEIADILTTAGFKDVPLSKPRANKPIKGDDGKFAGSEATPQAQNELTDIGEVIVKQPTKATEQQTTRGIEYATPDELEKIFSKTRGGNTSKEMRAQYDEFIAPKLANLPTPKEGETVVFYQPADGAGGQYVNTRLEEVFHYPVDENLRVEVVPTSKLKSTGVPQRDRIGYRMLDTTEANGVALAVAPITGIETDDEGHVKGFDPIKAGLGFAVVAGVSNARGTQAYQEAVQKGKTIISPRRQRTINNYGLNEDSVATILDAQRRGVIPHKETVNLAAKKTATIDKLITLQKGTITTGEQAEAYKQTVAGYKGHVRKLRENHLANPTDILLKKQYDDGMATLTRAYANLEAIYSEAGRVVESSKIVPLSRTPVINANIQKVRSELPPEAQVKFDMDLENLDLDNPTVVMDFLTNAQKPSWMRKVVEYYRASLLSAVTTQVINASGNILSTLADIPVRATAGAMSKGRTALTGKPRDVYMGEAWQLMSEGANSIGEASIHAFRAIKDEHYALQYDRARVESGTAIPQIKGKLGKVVRIPFRFLSAMDLFFRTVKTNSEASALMYRKARSEGLDGVELMARMEELKRQMPTEIAEQVTERAERALYLEDLQGFLKTAENAKNEHPWLQMLIPFYRTLVNLMREAYRMTPARFLSKDKWIKGADTKTEEQARAMLGTIAGLYLTNAVMDGRLEVTGAAPSDSKERDTFYGVGKQPYSIRVGDKWIPYQRVQPFSTILFLASKTADIWNFHKETGEMNPDDAADAASLLASEISQFFIDQAPMQGIATFIEFLEGGKYNQGQLPAAGDFFAQMLGGFVPNIIYSGVRAVDPTIYQTEGIVENIQKRVPGQQDNLVPRRGAMGDTSKRDGSPLGRFLNPFTASENTNDPIYNELERLGTGVGFPQKKAFQQDLTAEEYNVLMQDAGARTREALWNLMQSRGYQGARDDQKKEMIDDTVLKIRRESVGALFPHRREQLQTMDQLLRNGATPREAYEIAKEQLGLSDKEASSVAEWMYQQRRDSGRTPPTLEELLAQ